MEEIITETGRILAENGLYMVSSGAAAIAARGTYNSFKEVPDRFRKEAEAYSDDELAEQIYDLNATWRLTEHGAEFEGSKEEFYMFYDGFFKPRRSKRKEALTDEAKKRGIQFLELGQNDYIVGSGPEFENLPPAQDLREAIPKDELSNETVSYHPTGWINEQLENSETQAEKLRDEEEIESILNELEEEID